MKKYRECTRRKIERLLEAGKIELKNDSFYYKDTGLEVENI